MSALAAPRAPRRVALLIALGLALAALVGCPSSSTPPVDTPKPTTSAAAPAPKPAEPPAPKDLAAASRIPGAPRVVAIGDVHGDLSATRRALKLAGAINDDDRWIGGKLVLVQTGDLLDRGDDEQAIVDLFERLQDEAQNAGGRVVLLNGNHEIMNVRGDLRYVTPGGFKDFEDAPGVKPDDPRLKDAPEPARARLSAFLPGGSYAERISDHPVAAIVGDTVFVHGGILPDHVTYGLDRLNEETMSWIKGEASDMPKILKSSEAPIWSRHYSKDPGPEDCALLDATLKALNVKRMVVGHTVQREGITSACDAKVWRIDVGMAEHYGGTAQALEITPDNVRVLR